ncbi:hypothetical protein [Streptococcus rupicaprae]|uniref:hypothetical protein n=1 Tax=Streptococcus rupicaprae TaxID=759619 RepID=UPI0033924054
MYPLSYWRSKIRFTAIRKDVEPSTELGVGRQYVAGRNVEPGTYKLSSNVSLNKEYVEWRIEIVNLVTEDRRSQTLSGSNADVAIKLEEGEIISTDFSNHYEFEKPTGETRLILTSVN